MIDQIFFFKVSNEDVPAKGQQSRCSNNLVHICVKQTSNILSIATLFFDYVCSDAQNVSNMCIHNNNCHFKGLKVGGGGGRYANDLNK